MLVPIFELFYEQKNITKDVSPYVTSIEYTDVEHGESDELQITFEDSEKLWQGAWIKLLLEMKMSKKAIL